MRISTLNVMCITDRGSIYLFGGNKEVEICVTSMLCICEMVFFLLCQTLLDLGASPDYKDSRGLTPLYHSSMVGGDPYCCELLLHDHAQVGCVDENGWQEIHQVDAFS